MSGVNAGHLSEKRGQGVSSVLGERRTRERGEERTWSKKWDEFEEQEKREKRRRTSVKGTVNHEVGKHSANVCEA